MTDTISVRCRCGAVEIEISADPIAQFFCHCDDCQAVHGAAYAPESVYRASAVKVTRGEPSSWTLKRNPRFSCRECSTRLFIDVLNRGLRGVNAISWRGTVFRLSTTCSVNSPFGRLSMTSRTSSRERLSLAVPAIPSTGSAGRDCRRSSLQTLIGRRRFLGALNGNRMSPS